MPQARHQPGPGPGEGLHALVLQALRERLHIGCNDKPGEDAAHEIARRAAATP